MKLLFLDTETGGLDPHEAALVEVAWSVNGAPPKALVLPHSSHRVTPMAAEVNRYYERELHEPAKWATPEQIEEFREALKDATLVGANIAFDEAFLRANHYTGWHHRKLDLESYALPLVGMVTNKRGDGLVMPGLADIQTTLSRLTWLVGRIPAPDHTALGDVKTTIAVYEALSELYANNKEGVRV